MAEIYGTCDCEKKVLEDFPKFKKFGDIFSEYNENLNKLEERKEKFFELLPQKIKNEKKKLLPIIKDRKIFLRNLDERIKKIKGYENFIVGFFKILFLICFLKPFKLSKFKRNFQRTKKSIIELKNNPENFFKNEESGLINEIRRFEELEKSSNYVGAVGERKVLNRLSKLSDGYHVFCDVSVELEKWVKYKNKKIWVQHKWIL